MKALWVWAAISLIAIGCREQTAKPLSPTPTAPPEARQLVVPAKGAYTGAYIDFGESEDKVTLEKIEAFERAVGKHQAIVAFSSFWGEESFPMHNLEIIVRHKAVPLVYWSPWDKPYQQYQGPDRFSLHAIVAGKWDGYIDQWAAQAKSFGRPMLVAWGLEMNGAWFPWSGFFYRTKKGSSGSADGAPELFKTAYRRVVDRVRAAGANNILWVFHINNYSHPTEEWNAAKKYYPGDAYVDWLAMSAYGKQFPKDPWITATETMVDAYEDLCSLNPTKPVMLAEWGVGEFPNSGNKASWIAEAFELMGTRFPRLKAAIYWNERWQNEDDTHSNLRVTSSPQALEAYRNGVADSFWLDQPSFR
ncbi:MAG TPA: glycosyl hydrolase [Terrimicrobiaceae bacterium]